MLHANGRTIVDANNNVVRLNGFNLGGWLVFEKWMCPMDSGGIADTHGVIQTLDSRFGLATEQALIRTYQQSWITTADLDNISAGGYNLVRVPVWWGDFYPIGNTSNGAWRSDAFAILDWLVSNASSRGIYVIIDMHGAIGGQNTADWTGWANQNQYFGSATDQAQTAFMWSQIAAHYAGNGTVAGYDLLNEPGGTPNSTTLWNIYNSLYSTVRSVDPNHMIFMEGSYGSWNWSMLPPPSQYGWKNVVYEMHEYQFNGSAAQVMTGTDNQVNDFNNHASWNVPGYIGEWNDFGTGTSTWNYSNSRYASAGLSSSPWTYKAIHGVAPDSWGWYDPVSMPVATPNISSDSAATISALWSAVTTPNMFAKNTYLGM
jgi:endoglucanase